MNKTTHLYNNAAYTIGYFRFDIFYNSLKQKRVIFGFKISNFGIQIWKTNTHSFRTNSVWLGKGMEQKPK